MQKTEFDWINELTDLICIMSGWTANEAKTIIYSNGEYIAAGSANDKVYALPSSGVHSNGFSLVRKIPGNLLP